MGFLTVLLLSWALAVSCFIAGNLPLSFSFSKAGVAQLSTFGIGLLLGAALGVIIPEGVEAIYDASPEGSNPSYSIALSLLSGFTLMLVVEQVFITPSSGTSTEGYALAPNSSSLEGGRSSSNLHARMDSDSVPMTPGGSSGNSSTASRQARSITFGLVVHSIADGLALGASGFAAEAVRRIPSSHHTPPPHSSSTLVARFAPTTQPTSPHLVESTSSLTLIVFLALIIHKIPTALALSSSLLPLIPVRKIRMHLAIFSLATPFGALMSIMLLALATLGSKKGSSEADGTLWAGMALAFSGGTFLYVATVLQPVRNEDGASSQQSGHAHPGEDEMQSLGPKTRILLIILGIFLPVMVSSMFGHGHEHAHKTPSHG